MAIAEFKFTRIGDRVRMVRKEDRTPLDEPHHRRIVEKVYSDHQELPLPRFLIQYHSWDEVKDVPHASRKTLVFVNGGISEHEINLGRAVLINDGGIIRHSITCGIFFKDGGIIEKGAKITQTLLPHLSRGTS